MDGNTKSAGRAHQPKRYEVTLKMSNTARQMDIVFFEDAPLAGGDKVSSLESDEEIVPIIAAFAHKNYPSFNLIGVL